MSGSTSQQQNGPGRHTGWTGVPEDLRDALRGMLRYWMKDVTVDSVEMLSPPRLTMVPTAIPGRTIVVPTQTPEPEISMDPIRMLKTIGRTVHALPVHLEVTIASDRPCWDAPVVRCAPPLEADFTIQSADFSGMSAPESHETAIQLNAPKSETVPCNFSPDAKGQMKVHALALETLAGSGKKWSVSIKPIKILQDGRFFAIPIRKAPVPPHRFSPETRSIFCRALAEQAGTSAANIQLKAVFEHMQMSLYASIQADERGGLLCIPRRRAQAGADTESAWLALGVRLDNRESVRALVPRERLASVASQDSGDSPG